MKLSFRHRTTMVPSVCCGDNCKCRINYLETPNFGGAGRLATCYTEGQHPRGGPYGTNR